MILTLQAYFKPKGCLDVEKNKWRKLPRAQIWSMDIFLYLYFLNLSSSKQSIKLKVHPVMNQNIVIAPILWLSTCMPRMWLSPNWIILFQSSQVTQNKRVNELKSFYTNCGEDYPFGGLIALSFNLSGENMFA